MALLKICANNHKKSAWFRGVVETGFSVIDSNTRLELKDP